MLKFENISISRKKNKILDNFSMTLQDGVIFGLVGSDEMAKSAILQAASGCEPPDKGRITLNDVDIYASNNNLLQMGYMPQTHAFYDQLTVNEYYELFLALYKVNGRYRKRRVDEVLHFLEMEHYGENYLSDIPEDMRPFLALGKTILHEPEWLFLDHPFNDLGIAQRKRMLDYLDMLWEQGMSLVLNMEMFPEIASFVTDIAVIEEGQMISTGTIDSVYEDALRNSPIRLRVLDGMEQALKVLRVNDLVERVVVDGEDVILLFSGGDQEEAELLKSLIQSGALIHSFIRDPMDMGQIVWR